MPHATKALSSRADMALSKPHLRLPPQSQGLSARISDSVVESDLSSSCDCHLQRPIREPVRSPYSHSVKFNQGTEKQDGHEAYPWIHKNRPWATLDSHTPHCLLIIIYWNIFDGTGQSSF